MQIPDPRYRPNAARAIYVDGVLDDKLLNRLTPQMLRLLGAGRAPITIYITDSPGGDPAITKGILRLLRLSNQDNAKLAD